MRLLPRLLLTILPFAGGGPAPAAAQMSSSDVAMRLDALENQIRQLTGQVEQLQFRNQQLEQQLKRTTEDYEFRFQELGGKGAPRAAQPQRAPAPPGGAAAAADPAAAAAPIRASRSAIPATIRISSPRPIRAAGAATPSIRMPIRMRPAPRVRSVRCRPASLRRRTETRGDASRARRSICPMSAAIRAAALPPAAQSGRIRSDGRGRPARRQSARHFDMGYGYFQRRDYARPSRPSRISCSAIRPTGWRRRRITGSAKACSSVSAIRTPPKPIWS